MAALAQENIWLNKAQCEKAELLYNEKLSRDKKLLSATVAEDPKITLSAQIVRACRHLKNSVDCFDESDDEKVNTESDDRHENANTESDDRHEKVNNESDNRHKKVNKESDDRHEKVNKEADDRHEKVNKESDNKHEKVNKESDDRHEKVNKESDNRHEKVNKEADDRHEKVNKESDNKHEKVKESDDNESRKTTNLDSFLQKSLISDQNKMAALAHENVWLNKAECEEAERLYYEKFSCGKDTMIATSTRGPKMAQIQTACQHIKNSLECVDILVQTLSEDHVALVDDLRALDIENKQLEQVTEDLKSFIHKLENIVALLEDIKGGSRLDRRCGSSVEEGC
jgi:hypothetical protein